MEAKKVPWNPLDRFVPWPSPLDTLEDSKQNNNTHFSIQQNLYNKHNKTKKRRRRRWKNQLVCSIFVVAERVVWAYSAINKRKPCYGGRVVGGCWTVGVWNESQNAESKWFWNKFAFCCVFFLILKVWWGRKGNSIEWARNGIGGGCGSKTNSNQMTYSFWLMGPSPN